MIPSLQAALSQRGRVWLVALLFLGGVGARTAHWIATPHRHCEIHDRLEHGPEIAGEHEGSATPEGPRYASSDPVEEECDLPECTRTEKELLPSSPGPSGIQPRLAGGRELTPEAPEPESALYLLAPSRSPPV